MKQVHCPDILMLSLPKEEWTMNYLVLAGRILYAAIFVMAGPGHFTAKTIAYAASRACLSPR
jgi:uncharacterized membrane protein YphA (DoxX/SURF4 family)